MGKNKKFEQLTKYITLFEKDSFGEWRGGDTNDDVLTIPYVSYTDAVLDFIHDLHDFAQNNEQYEMRHYREVLDKKGIKNFSDMKAFDINNADAKTVLCMLMYIVRTDRFIEGTLIRYLKNSYIGTLLIRLKEIDMMAVREEIDKVIKDVWLNEICVEYGQGYLIREASL
ncbi:MAG: hypothetical protein IKL40_02255, partial [Clostridia bacterium]|nr:hypothetical protein [Clostridia bacterium]